MAPTNARRPTIDEKLLSKVIAQIDEISSTLNQIAKHVKAGRVEGDIDDALCDLLDCRTMLMQALRQERYRQIF
jgi:hypothetical protein